MPSTNSSTPQQQRGGSRSNANARNEIIDMLKEDHKRAKKAFRDFEKLEPTDERAQQIVEQVCNELTLHTTLEEELLYPAAKEALKEADLVNEAEVEHASAKDLIEQLKSMSPDDEKYAATFTVLGEYIKHHVKEEENEMFPQLQKVRGLDWESLCDEMNGRRQELMQELMPEDIEADETEDEAGTAKAGGARRAASASRRSAGSEGRAQAAGAKRSARGKDADVESSEDVGGESD